MNFIKKEVDFSFQKIKNILIYFETLSIII
jgi:hypothetical protein